MLMWKLPLRAKPGRCSLVLSVTGRCSLVLSVTGRCSLVLPVTGRSSLVLSGTGRCSLVLSETGEVFLSCLGQGDALQSMISSLVWNTDMLSGLVSNRRDSLVFSGTGEILWLICYKETCLGQGDTLWDALFLHTGIIYSSLALIFLMNFHARLSYLPPGKHAWMFDELSIVSNIYSCYSTTQFS